MKKSFAKILSLILIALMLVSILSACKDKGKTNTNNGTEVDNITGTDENPNLPSKNYDGYEFTFLTSVTSAHNVKYIVSAGEEGETLDSAVDRRNDLLEEKYNIKIRQMGASDAVTEVRTQVMGGMVEFDAILATCANLATMAQEGLLYNLLELDLFSWDASYWDSNSKDQLKIGDKLYFTNCALDIDGIGFAVYFNKKLVQDYQLDDPYSLMKDNKWTLDNWAKMVKSVSRDLDSDGDMDEFDQYGSLIEHHNARMFLYASGVRGTTNDENGYPVITLMDNPDKTVGIYEKLKEVLSDTSVAYCMTCSKVGANGYAHKWAYLQYLFTQDHYLFHYTNNSVLPALADMESEFGIVPFPKHDEKQEVYKTFYPYNCRLLAVPSLSKDIDRTEVILEDMNYFSSITIIPAWYETLLARRYTRDDESEASLNLLRNNCVYDIGLYYNFGGLRSKILDANFKTTNIARTYDSYKRGIEADIQKVYENFQKAE